MYSICHSVFPLVGGVYVWGREGIGGGGGGTVEEGAHERSCVLITAF